MKRIALQVIAVALGIGLGSATYAQGRHDEKPHGSAKPAASAEGSTTPGMTGRHDERPHGPPTVKKQAVKKKAAEGDSK